MGQKKRGRMKKIQRQQSLFFPSLVGLESTQRPGKEPQPDKRDIQEEPPDDSYSTVATATTHNHKRETDAKHDESSSSSTDCSGFALQSLIVVNWLLKNGKPVRNQL